MKCYSWEWSCEIQSLLPLPDELGSFLENTLCPSSPPSWERSCDKECCSQPHNHTNHDVPPKSQNFQTSVCPIHWTYGIPLMVLPRHVMNKENQYMKRCLFCRQPFQLYNRHSVSHWLGGHIEAGELGSKVNLEICWYHLGEVVIGRSAY